MDTTAVTTEGPTAEAALPAWQHARPVDLPTLRRRTEGLLRARVPLTLLLDLVDPHGPDSQALYGAEGGDSAWLHAC